MTDLEAIEYAENELENTSYTLETNNKLRLGWCSHHMDRENPDDFCSWGQRREE